MANQQKPNQQEPRPADQDRQPGQQAGNPQGVDAQHPQRHSGKPGEREPSRPGATPGTTPDRYRHPGDEPDVQSDVIAGKSQKERAKQQGAPGAGNPSGSDKPKHGNTGGNRSDAQEDHG